MTEAEMDRLFRRFQVESQLTGEVIFNPKVSDEALGKLVRLHMRAAHERLKERIPYSVSPFMRTWLWDYEDPQAAEKWVRLQNERCDAAIEAVKKEM